MDYNGFDSDSMAVEGASNGHNHDLREQVLEQAEVVVQRAQETAQVVAHKAQESAQVVAARVRENPLPVIVVAAGITGFAIAGFLLTRQLRKKSLDEYKFDAAKAAVRAGKKAAISAIERLDRMEVEQPSAYESLTGRLPAAKTVHQITKMLRD
jgi:ElaB/YqjD/DUF883 family membrane-anchored ribosome-binding protein